MAHPAVLNDLVEQYEALQRLDAAAGAPEARKRMDDIAYTLCVTTGTRDIEAALGAARSRLLDASPQRASLLTP
jgi:hypothetical protein